MTSSFSSELTRLQLLQQQSNGVGVEDARLLLVCMYDGIYFALASLLACSIVEFHVND
jgi:hypothetical protein